MTVAGIGQALKAYGAALDTKPELVALNKADLLSPEAMAETLAKFRKRVRKAPLVMSGATGKGVREAMAKLLTEVDKRRPAPASRNGRDDHSGPDGPDEWHP